jgi:hypothetical protein
MSLPNSYQAFAAEYEALERASADPKGIRIEFSDRGEASAFRFRLHHARRVDREKNKEIYKEGDPLYGSSIFDPIVCRLKQDTSGKWWVYLEKNAIPGVVESLSDGELP